MHASALAPRLTSALRLVLSDGSTDTQADPEAQWVERNEGLRTAPRDGSTDANGGSTGSELSWDVLLRQRARARSTHIPGKKSKSTDDTVEQALERRARAQFRQLMALAAEVTPQADAGGDAVGAAAAAIYDATHSGSAEAADSDENHVAELCDASHKRQRQQKRKALEVVLGKVSDSQWTEFENLSSALWSWSTLDGRVTPISQGDRGPGVCGGGDEYGAHLAVAVGSGIGVANDGLDCSDTASDFDSEETGSAGTGTDLDDVGVGGHDAAHASLVLLSLCEQHVAVSNSGDGAVPCPFTPQQLASEVMLAMHAAFGLRDDSGSGRAGSSSHRPNTEEASARLQSSLFDLLGAAALELISHLLDEEQPLRHGLLQATQRTLDEAIEQLSSGTTPGFAAETSGLAGFLADTAGDAALAMQLSAENGQSATSAAHTGSPGATGGNAGFQNYGVRTTSGIAAERAAKRLARRGQRQAASAARAADRDMSAAALARTDPSQVDYLEQIGFDAEMLRQERLLGLQGGANSSDAAHSGADYYAQLMKRSGGKLHDYGLNKALPKGSTREYKTGYEEVHIPLPEPLPIDDASLIAIDSLDEVAQLAFRGIETLNRLQSELFSTAYQSNENMLVCAPTGAGKTNVAMLALVRALRQAMEDGEGGAQGMVDAREFKIIYVAPMKALAAEVVDKFGKRLAPLGVQVKECTGDMQLTRAEVERTHVVVTTPEKWDVMTRKSGEGSLIEKVKLLLIDEVHLLADERGPVIESIVARTLREVEKSQRMIRIVGLSATLPNYQDVGLFLRCNPQTGVFRFDNRYRPVPLEQRFLGITEKNRFKGLQVMNELAYEQALRAITEGHQVMIFVHSRKDTAKTAMAIHELAVLNGTEAVFQGIDEDDAGGVTAIDAEGARRSVAVSRLKAEVDKSRNQDLRKLFAAGFGVHHAGMLRADRKLSERLFSAGAIRVLCCTATLAWGVNLPAHMVIIKGTQVYNADRGGLCDLSMLDVMQIFGRAGRPQFDTSGEAVMITTNDALPRYLGMLQSQAPMESQFIGRLADHLNAEIVSGTVTNMREAVTWMSYTFCFVRMLRNPLAYGVTWDEKEVDPLLEEKRHRLLETAAQTLDDARMVRFDRPSGNLAVTDVGRTASHFYILHESVDVYNTLLRPHMTETEIFDAICHSKEFENIKVRDDELTELSHARAYAPLEVKSSIETTLGKANILLQAYISGHHFSSFTLISDSGYISQNAGRVTRALFELCLKRDWPTLADQMLTICKAVDKRMWWFQTPLRQFRNLKLEVARKLEEALTKRGQGTAIGGGAGGTAQLERLIDMEPRELGQLVRHNRAGPQIFSLLRQLPWLQMEPTIQPITSGILRVTLVLRPQFEWNDRVHGSVEPWWVWVEDGENEHIYHSEYVLLHRKQWQSGEPIKLDFTIPVFEPLPPQYYVRATSDRWLGSSQYTAVSFRHLLLPRDMERASHTDLLDLTPLPIAALHEPRFEAIYPYSHFNPVQTQYFHSTYHTDDDVLLGAPTGSGKTVCAELAIMRMLRRQRGKKAVYIAPLKALARERLKDWKKKFGVPVSQGGIGAHVVELTGDVAPDMGALSRSDIIITTPEKWDGVSRSWRKRDYVRNVRLLILDEVHLLGEERGPVLEVIVSRMRIISEQLKTQKVKTQPDETDQAKAQQGETQQKGKEGADESNNAPEDTENVRFVALSTAVANASDLADWLGVRDRGLFNFRPSVRPVPLRVHIQGFPGKHYCPRMATMNKPTYAAIKQHSPRKPVLVFVSSRRQTRLTALDLISYCAADEEPRQFLHKDEAEMATLLERVHDGALKHTLAFGIGIHHAGLAEFDRSAVEELFVSGQIQVLVCTSTLAWGVNFPAHLVVVKGTEFFDGKLGRYVDFPVTDVLQMMGRAGRPQFDDSGRAVILVHAPKKNFYRKFLYQPFPVESHLRDQLHNHFNAEVATRTIQSVQDAVDYLTWTYFFRRLLANPSFYHLEDTSPDAVREYLQQMCESVLGDLEGAGCVTMSDDFLVEPSTLGLIASYYYLEYTSVGMFCDALCDRDLSLQELAKVLADAHEYDELPVRHNEDQLNEQLARVVPWPVDELALDDAHTKAYLLIQAHLTRAALPISDYINDTKSVMDQSLRILNAMIDIASDEGQLANALGLMRLTQLLIQARTPDKDPLTQLPHVNAGVASALNRMGIRSLNDFPRVPFKTIAANLANGSDSKVVASGAGRAGDRKGRRFGRGKGGRGGRGGRAGRGGRGSGGHAKSEEQEPSSTPAAFDAGGAKQRWNFDARRLKDLERVLATMPFMTIASEVEAGEDTQDPSSGGVAADSECSLHVTLNTLSVPGASSHGNNRGGSFRVHAPRYRKAKEHGFWLVLGAEATDDDGSGGELLAVKRMNCSRRQQNTTLSFFSPEERGKHLLKLWVVFDSIHGMDITHYVTVNCTEDAPLSDADDEDEEEEHQ